MRAYHVTPRHNRLSIFRRGLLPRDTTQHNYPDARDNAGVEAVYVFDSWERADTFRRDWYHELALTPDELDVWEVYVADLPIEPDGAVHAGQADGLHGHRRLLSSGL